MHTATPIDIERVKIHRTALNKVTQQCLLECFNNISKVINLDLKKLQEKYLNLNLNKKLNPSYYSMLSELMDLMEDSNQNEILVILDKLESLEIYNKIDFIEILAIDQLCHDNLYATKYFHKNNSVDYIGQKAQIYPTTEEDVKPYIPYINDAIKLIHDVDPIMHAEILELISVIRIFKGKAMIGATLRQTFGAVFLKLPEEINDQQMILQYFIEHIVHESSHLLLHAMMSTDPIVLNQADAKYEAPIRTDLRPMYGVFHATFVISRMLRIFRKMENCYGYKYKWLTEHFRPKFESGIKVINSFALLTPTGQKIFETLEYTAYDD